MAGRTERAKKNIIWGLVNKIVLMLIPFIKRTMILYVLGREYLGLDSLFTSVLQMLNIAEIGFSSAIIFSMYKPIARHDEAAINALLNYYRRIYRIIGLVVLGAGIMLTPFLRSFIKGDVPDGMNIYLLYFIYLINTSLGYWLFAYKKALITAHQQENILSNTNSLISILRIIVQFIIVVVLKNYYAYIVIMPIATVAENICVSVAARRAYPQYVCRGQLDAEVRRDIGRRVKGLFIQKICATSRNSMDNVVISAFIGLSAVAIYGNYYTIMNSVHFLLGCVPMAITAGIGDSIASESVEKNHENMLRFNFMYLWLAGWVTICMLCLYQPFITLWVGADNTLPFYTVFAICFYHYALCMGDIRYLYTTGAGLWWEGRYRSILEAATNIVLNLLLGKLLGIFGIVLATIISIVCVNFVFETSILYKHYFKNGGQKRFFLSELQYFLVTCAAGAATYIVCSLMSFGGIGDLMYRVPVCVLVPNCVYFICYHKKPEFAVAVAMGKRLLRKNIG